MKLSKIMLAALALAVAGTSIPAFAADTYGTYRRKYRIERSPYSYGYPIGGHRFGWQHDGRPFTSAYNFPGWYNNQTFWERVQTQGNYPVQY
jgi:hypothetical protein